MTAKTKKIAALLFLFICFSFPGKAVQERPRASDLGIKIGILEPGRYNAITDVKGVKVGHVTLIKKKHIRTGVTAILPHGGNIYLEKVPAAIYIANGYGKLTGISQVEELGNIETPIVLTNTLSVPTAAAALVDYTLDLAGNEDIRSVNPVVGETNDGWLNDIRGRHVKQKHVLKAIAAAVSGPVAEGCVGAGTGTLCLGFKGGIGTASRVLPENLGGYSVGVLVQTNFGGSLQVAGCPVGLEMGRYYLKERLIGRVRRTLAEGISYNGIDQWGSCMIVVATDAPLCARNLKRLAKRAILGLARAGGNCSNGSGDYVIAFSTAEGLRVPYRSGANLLKQEVLRNERVTPLFLAAAEAVEEAILNSIFRATSMKGRDGHIEDAISIEKVKEILKKYNRIK